MTAPRPSPLSFTKLVVHDLEAMADYYCTVFGLHRGKRDRFEKGILGEPIDEVSLTLEAGAEHGPLVLIRFLERPAVREDETILGFTTDDLAGLLERVERAGGERVSEIRDYPDHGVRVVMTRDPEGHLNEIVEAPT